MLTIFKAVTPVFPVASVAAAIAHYQDVLGFDVAWRWGNPVVVAAVCRDGIEIMFDETAPDKIRPGQIYVTMTGLDDYLAGIVARGARVIYPIADRPYGMRDVRIADPDGNEISFGEPITAEPGP
ncbi:MAG TPA: glyoxalase superfamily protein [Hyphomicrobiaceae bacterium]|nr:glyoxalase superfamily protein [Hyphomicrobiaceae bacterium]